MQYVGTGRQGTHQSASYTGTAGTITNAITDQVTKVRVIVTSAAYVKIDKSPTATSSDMYMPADSAEYFTVSAGMKVSAIQVTSSGTLHVTEIA